MIKSKAIRNIENGKKRMQVYNNTTKLYKNVFHYAATNFASKWRKSGYTDACGLQVRLKI